MDAISVVEAAILKKGRDGFRPGDTVRVHVKVVEGEKERVQVFEGLVIRRRGEGARAPFNGMLTPYGFPVWLFIWINADRKSSGRIGPAAITPMPPALDTAMTSGALEEAQLIAAWKIGCSIPRSSVMRVFISFPAG